MMGLTDFAMYVAILASVGAVQLAVTTNLNINFLRKPAPRDLIAETRLIKLGKRLAVGEGMTRWWPTRPRLIRSRHAQVSRWLYHTYFPSHCFRW